MVNLVMQQKKEGGGESRKNKMKILYDGEMDGGMKTSNNILHRVT